MSHRVLFGNAGIGVVGRWEPSPWLYVLSGHIKAMAGDQDTLPGDQRQSFQVDQDRSSRTYKTYLPGPSNTMPTFPPSVEDAWRSERLVYRAIEDNEEDKTWICENIDKDPVNMVMGSLGAFKPGSMASAANFIQRTKGSMLRVFACLPPADEDYGNGKEGDEKTEKTKEKGKGKGKPTPIGYVALFSGGGPDGAHHRSAHLGINLARLFRGKGYSREVINWVLDWGFYRAGLHRVGLGVFSFNMHALELYRSLGFVEEGRQREAVLYERKWWDIIDMGMLEGEWEKLRGIAAD